MGKLMKKADSSKEFDKVEMNEKVQMKKLVYSLGRISIQ
jgi:hypothetical protein